MEGTPPPDRDGLSDDKLISHLAERVAEYTAAKRKKKRIKKTKA
jgi:hypothetical protein